MVKRSVEQIYEEWLVIRCQGGDREALKGLIDRWDGRLRAFVWRLTNGDDEAKDILQEVWINVFKKTKRLNDPTCFPQWVYKIARAKCADWVRKKKRDRNLRDDIAAQQSANTDAEIQSSDSKNVRSLKEALRRLQPELRVTMSLFYIEELSTKAIAEALGIPVGTVKSRLHTARELLKKTIVRSTK